jgi:hypothetical protein
MCRAKIAGSPGLTSTMSLAFPFPLPFSFPGFSFAYMKTAHVSTFRP